MRGVAIQSVHLVIMPTAGSYLLVAVMATTDWVNVSFESWMGRQGLDAEAIQIYRSTLIASDCPVCRVAVTSAGCS